MYVMYFNPMKFNVQGIKSDSGDLRSVNVGPVNNVGQAALEKYTTYIVEKRRCHGRSGQAASDLPIVMQYLYRDSSFQANHHLLRVFKLCCLNVGMPREKYPAVSFDLSGCAVKAESFDCCLLLVQSYKISAGY